MPVAQDDSRTWDKVMAMKKNDTRHNGIANNLTDDELETIIGTVDFFQGSVKQSVFDLKVARYRVFDWLAMCVMGDRICSTETTKVLAYSFLKVEGDIDRWIADLRETDYDINEEWRELEL